MKKRLLFYTLMIFQLFSFSLFASGTTEKNKLILFENKNVNLILTDNPLEITVKSADSKSVFSKLQSFSFKIKDKWVSIQRVISVDDKSGNTVNIKLLLTDKNIANLKITNSAKSLFKIKITSNAKKITAVRGINALYPVEEIYGFGETWNGSVAQRGKSLDIWDVSGTPDECAYMPYYVSTQNYAFWLEYGGLVHFDVGKSNANELRWEYPSDKIIINLFVGNSLAEAVQGFVKATGLPSKPPRWAYKPWAWLMHDPDKPGADISTLRGKHAIYMVKKFKELNIPIGVTWVEPPWQTERTSFIPNKKFDPDIKETIAKLNKLGVKTLAWTVPYTTRNSPNWNEAVKNNYIVGMPGEKKTSGEIKITRSGEIGGKTYNYIDFTNPSAVKWWQSEIEKAIDLGFAGFKLDAAQNLERDALLYGNKLGKDWHNAYAHYYNKTFYEILKKKRGNNFLMIPRAAFIGTGKYTNFKWPGDLTATFGNNGLPASVYSTLSASLSGLPFLATDIGGFNGRPAPENVWIRWAQFGAMIPGMETLNMPWWYSEKAQAHYRFLSWLHTDLIPYWESLGNEAATSGTPICRHLVWDYQNDIETWRVDDEFTVGKFILVAPILESNALRKVYLPEGRWYDFWDDSQSYEGGKWIKYFKGWRDNLYKFPLYIREGAIIPLAVENEISGFGYAQSAGYTTMAIWPMQKGKSSFTLWDDKEKTVFDVSDSDDNIVVSWDNSEKDYILRIHYDREKRPQRVVEEKKSPEVMKRFTKLQDFLNSKENGWVFVPEIRKILIRKTDCSNSNVVKIYK